MFSGAYLQGCVLTKLTEYSLDDCHLAPAESLRDPYEKQSHTASPRRDPRFWGSLRRVCKNGGGDRIFPELL